MSKKSKLITLNIETYEKLQNFGTMKDTFDSVINRIIEDSLRWRIIEKEFFGSEGFPSYVYIPNNATSEQSLAITMGSLLGWLKDKGLLEKISENERLVKLFKPITKESVDSSNENKFEAIK